MKKGYIFLHNFKYKCYINALFDNCASISYGPKNSNGASFCERYNILDLDMVVSQIFSEEEM